MSDIHQEEALKKMQLYVAAVYLFNDGKSHPQIVEMLNEHESNLPVLTAIVNKAMKEEWDKLNVEAGELFANNYTYDEVLQKIHEKEPDLEIAKLICGPWYDVKTEYMESVVEGSTNRYEGLKWVLISGIAIPILFYFELSWISKSIWIVVFVGSLAQWLVGLQQRKTSKKIDAFFSQYASDNTGAANQKSDIS